MKVKNRKSKINLLNEKKLIELSKNLTVFSLLVGTILIFLVELNITPMLLMRFLFGTLMSSMGLIIIMVTILFVKEVI